MLKQIVPNRKVSQFVAEAIEEKLQDKTGALLCAYKEAYSDKEREKEAKIWDVGIKKSIKRGDVYWVKLNPTVGSEINKTRPAVVISNDIQNEIGVRFVVSPITSSVTKVYPFETLIKINDKQAKAQLDQIRTIYIKRLGDFIVHLSDEEIKGIDIALKLVLAIQ